eukprot:9478816-Pyramimonas_sp.AAC.1
MPPRKRKRVSRFVKEFARRRYGWELRGCAGEHGPSSSARRKGADALEEHLLVQYASGALDAKAFCLTCFYAVQAGVESDNLAQYAHPPTDHAGKFSQHLRSVLPESEAAPEYHFVSVP